MILDTIAEGQRYTSLHPKFKKAFAFLQHTDLAALEDGRHEIDGDHVFALAMTVEGRGHDGARLEVHRAYIDIQAVVSGDDVIGWSSQGLCTDDEGFDKEKDVGFYADSCASWVAVPPGCFGIFFPADAHAPLAGQGEVKKVVVKVAV